MKTNSNCICVSLIHVYIHLCFISKCRGNVNIATTPPYLSGEPCSECPSTHDKCDNKLCASKSQDTAASKSQDTARVVMYRAFFGGYNDG